MVRPKDWAPELESVQRWLMLKHYCLRKTQA
jgi:hypothetical protein